MWVIITAVVQIQVMHLLLFFWEKVQFSYGVWDALERNKTALILLQQVDEPTSLGFGANALNTGLSSKERVINAAEQGLSVEQARISVSKSHANSVFRAYAGDAAVFAVQPMRRAVFASLRHGGFGTVPRERSFFSLILQWPSWGQGSYVTNSLTNY